MVPGTLSLEVKRPGREADHPPPSSAEVENAWSYTSTPQYVFMVWCLVKHRDNFIFYVGTNKLCSCCSSNFVMLLVYNKRVYLNVSGLAAWSENCKWDSSLPVGAFVSLLYESV
jgi:hypothetical protein